MRFLSYLARAVLGCALAVALTAAAAPTPNSSVLDVTPGRGVSGTVVTVAPRFSALATCTLYWETKPDVETTPVVSDFVCGVGPSKAFGATTYAVKGPPGTYYVTVCQPLCGPKPPVLIARSTFVVLATVPDLKGLTRSQADQGLVSAGLTFGKVLPGSATNADAQVVRQSLASGAVVTAKTPVSVELQGPPVVTPPVLVTVPDVRQHSLADAQQALANLGLTGQASAAAGTVVAQDPAPGARVPPGSPVNLTVQPVVPPGPRPDPGPPLVAALVGAGFVVVVVIAMVGLRARTIRRRQPRERSTPAGRIDARFVPPTFSTTHPEPTSPKAGPDIHVRLTRGVVITVEEPVESRQP